MIYLASPYSNPSPEVRSMRFRAACLATGNLIKRGHLVFSPIAHTHPVREISGLGGSFADWERYDENIINRCDGIFVLCIEGWEESVGVQAEIVIASKLPSPIPVEYLTPESVELDFTFPYLRTVGQRSGLI